MKTPQDSQYSQPPVKDTKRTLKPLGKPRVKVNKQRAGKKSPLGGCLVTLSAIAALIAAGSIIVGGIWLGILLMINPNAVVWLNQFLPEWTRIPIAVTSPPQTLAAIQDEVRKSGLIPGEPITLDNSDLLLPLLASSPTCKTDCEKIVELRVYQATQPSVDQRYYRLVNQLPISGPEEYLVLSVPATGKSGSADLSRKLPLTKLTRFDEKAPAEGIWFNLSGERLSGDTPMTYGQIIHYNPDQTHLSIMLQWTSPNELQPYWQQVTGESTPEVVVNQTVGLEPHFQVYQIKPRKFVPNPIYLQEISLAEPALDTQAYRNGLILARNGLWSAALQLLQSQKKQNWSVAAQVQMDVIQLHAQVTESQAKQAWPTPSQQIFANLIDGRWADALLVFQSSESGAPVQEIVMLLKTDAGGLWQRVEAALKVNPKDSNVKAWGALMMAAQQGRPKAIAWLKELQKTQSADNSQAIAIEPQINDLLDHLDAALAAASPASSHISQIIGTAQLVAKVNPSDWLQPEEQDGGLDTGQNSSQFPVFPNLQTSIPKLPGPKALPLQKELQQVWYQIEVGAFNDGQRWQQAPFSNLKLPKVVKAKQLWQYLGLDFDSQIQITVWNAEGSQEATIATVKGVSYRGGIIQLLAAGEALPAATAAPGAVKRIRPLAYTDAALRWLEPGSLTLSDLNNIQPQWVSVLLPTLWRELLKSGQIKSGAMPSLPVMLSDMGHWSVRLVDLTGNNQQEAVLTLYEDLSGALKKPDDKPPVENSQLYKPRTLIFSDQGALLYSEFSKDANGSLSAIADLGDGGSAALVIDGKSNYSLKRWSAQRKRFE